MATRGMSTNHTLVLDLLWTCPSSQNGGCQHVVSDDFIKNASVLPWLAVCGTDLHGHRINKTLLCDTMEVSMIAFRGWPSHSMCSRPHFTGKPDWPRADFVENCLLRTRSKATAVSRFRDKLSPANGVQGITAISRKIALLDAMSAKLVKWEAKKWGPTCDCNISDSAIYTTTIYREYTVLQSCTKPLIYVIL